MTVSISGSEQSAHWSPSRLNMSQAHSCSGLERDSLQPLVEQEARTWSLAAVTLRCEALRGLTRLTFMKRGTASEVQRRGTLKCAKVVGGCVLRAVMPCYPFCLQLRR